MRKSFHPKIGLIPDFSYGRLIDFLCGVYALSNDRTGNVDSLAGKVVWIPNSIRSQYPFIYELLQSRIHIAKSSTVLRVVYRLLTKLHLSSLIAHSARFEILSESAQYVDSNSILEEVNKRLLPLMTSRSVPQVLDRVLNSERKLILIYCRNDYWDNQIFGPQSIQSKIEGFRNVSHRTFIPVIDLLQERGYQVVRIGRDDVQLKNSSHYWNYASDPIASDFVDMVLWSRASGVITTSGGADTPKRIFDVPTLYLNLRESPGATVYNLIRPVQVMLPAVYFRDKEILSVSQLDKFGFLKNKFETKSLNRERVSLKDNSDKVALQSVSDFLLLLETGENRFVKTNNFLSHPLWPNLQESRRLVHEGS